LQYMRSFLTLQDALVLRSTCRQLYNDGYDAYRYCSLLTYEPLAKNGFTGGTCSWQFLKSQDHVLTRFQHDDKLRAILKNDYIPTYHLRRFIWAQVKTATTDNPSTINILLKDGRCDVDTFVLDQALRRNLTNMANALQQDERVKSGIQMCAACHVNVGCFECFRDLDCASLPEPTNGRIWCSWDELPPKFRQPKKYCRTCVVKDNQFCKVCSEYLCRVCRKTRNHESCERCHGILCLDDFFTKQPVVICDECPRIKCRKCLHPGEGWLEVVENGFPICMCPNCKGNYVPGQIGRGGDE